MQEILTAFLVCLLIPQGLLRNILYSCITRSNPGGG